MIETEVVAINRYAPRGSEGIKLYSTDLSGATDLTIGQLTIAVAMRCAAAYEAQSVLKMNSMTAGSEKLDKAAQYMQDISEGTGDWASMKTWLKNELGVSDELPDAIDTYQKRMTAIAAVKAKVDALTQTQQEEMIDLQTLVNRRDVAFSASSNVVRTLGRSQNANAVNF